MAGESSPPPASRRPIEAAVADELVNAVVRLARGDFSVRLPRNYRRDTEDVIAYLVNAVGEEMQRLLSERDRVHAQLEADVTRLNEVLVALASGNFAARAPRTGQGDPIDVLAYMLNNMAEEIGDTFGQIERQRDVLEAILESMIDGVLLLDAEERIVRANGAMVSLLGHQPTSLVGAPVAAVLHDSERELAAGVRRALEGGPFRDRDTVFRTAAGERLMMSVNGSPQKNRAGELVGILLVARDDRELRRVRAKLQITDRLATMGTVAAGVAHEINNPLAFVLGNLDFIAEELEALEGGKPIAKADLDELRRAVVASHGGATRVRQIVQDLKTFARSDPHVVTRVDLNKLIDSAMSLVANEVRHHARLVREPGAPPPVSANEGRLVQVFLNLVQNAAHAIPAGHVESNTIRLATGPTEDGAAFVEITDTGCGIGPEHLPHIFDLFFTTKPVGVGTGLGLSICHEIVTSLGGRIDVTSTPGQGSTFRVILPAARESMPPPPVAPERVAADDWRGARVLVVDDEAEVGETVKRLLGNEHEVVAVTRAEEALGLALREDYDVVLCDLLMPEMTGPQLFDKLRSARPDLASRFVFMSGGAFDTSVRQFLQRTSRPIVEKPFETTRLRALLREAARGADRRGT